MKFHGAVGFWCEEAEVKPGVWKSQILERSYVGDILRNNRRFQPADQQNDNFTISNQISILGDLYARENFDSIRYVIWNKVAWKVTSVEINYPRLILELGGVYNGERPIAVT